MIKARPPVTDIWSHRIREEALDLGLSLQASSTVERDGWDVGYDDSVAKEAKSVHGDALIPSI